MNTLDQIIDISYSLNKSLDEIHPGDQLTGKILIRPKENVGFDTVTFFLRKVTTGKLSLGKEKLEIIRLAQDSKWSKGKLYEFDVSFSIPLNAFSFEGEHLEVLWFITLELDPNQETMSSIRMDLMKNIKIGKLFGSLKGKFTSDYHLEIKPISNTYQIKDATIHFKNPSYGLSLAGLAVFFIVGICYLTGLWGFMSYIGLGIATISLGYAYYVKSSIGQLGKILVGVTGFDDTSFNLDIKPQKNLNRIEYVQLFYSINEEVTDNRGSDTTTYRNTLYTSPKTKLRTFGSDNINALLKLPTEKYPGTFEFKSAKIFWQLHVAFEFKNNTHYVIKEPFIVSIS